MALSSSRFKHQEMVRFVASRLFFVVTGAQENGVEYCHFSLAVVYWRHFGRADGASLGSNLSAIVVFCNFRYIK